MRVKYFVLLIPVLLIIACHNDLDEVTRSEGTTLGAEVIDETSGDLTGYVYDENFNPVAGVSINTFGDQTTTDQNGVFILRNTRLDGNGTFISATKEGYIFGSDMIYPNGATNYSAIQLLRLDNTATINASAGGLVEIEGGGSVNFSANSFVDSNGSPYGGEISVTAKRLATDDPNLGDQMPGGLIGMDQAGATRVLGSAGMVVVELRSPSGEELNLAPGSTAALRFQLADDLIADAPDEIPLWFFDEANGIWVEEGSATLSGGVYEGSVSHVSFWNCDVPFPLINLCGQITCPNDFNPAGLQIAIFVEGLGCRIGYTDDGGVFCGKVPKDEVLTIRVAKDICGNPTTVEVGPFSDNTVLDDIFVDKGGLELNGNIECLGVPVGTAYVLLSVGNATIPFLANEDGSVDLSYSDLCNVVDEVSVQAFDPNTGNESEITVIDLSEGVQEIDLDFSICAECDFDGNIEFDLSNCDAVTAGFIPTGNPANLTYLWSTGETSSQISVEPNTLVCVTVTDTDQEDCEVIKCEEISNLAPQWIEIDVSNVGCDGSLGSAEFFYDESAGEVEILVEGPGGYLSTENPAADMPIGDYTLTLITIAGGCTVTRNFSVNQEGNLSLYAGFLPYCGAILLEPIAAGGTQPYTFFLDGLIIEDGSVTIDELGTYTVEVEDASGCSISTSVEIDEIPESPEFNYSTACDGFDVSITFESSCSCQTYQRVSDSFTIDLVDGETWEYNLATELSDFSHSFFIERDSAYCNDFVQLPEFEGLTDVAGNSPSCETCEDGWIDIIIDGQANCNSCVFGEVAVYNVDDLETNLITENTNQALTVGEYVVAVLDANTDCVIALMPIVL